MKKVLLLLLLTAVLLPLQAQHTKTLLRKANMRGDFRNFSIVGTTVFGVGYDFGVRSFVMKSTDQGVTWAKIAESPFRPADNLNAIDFPTPLIGYVAGSNGIIYKTTNGGLDWRFVGDTVLNNWGYSQIKFFNADTGYVCGTYGTTSSLFKTTNGGTSWTAVTVPLDRSMNDMYWEGPLYGILVGGSGRYLRTTDGGANWLAGTFTGTTSTMYRIRKAAAGKYYVAGSAGKVYKSTDDGLTFNPVTGNPGTTTFYTCEWLDENTGICAGSAGYVARTTDGGATWSVVPQFTFEVIRVSLALGGKVFLAPYNSNYYSTADWGLTWVRHFYTSRDQYGVYAENENNIVTVGDYGEVWLTTNGGSAWKKCAGISNATLMYDAAKFGNYIYASGRSGAYFVSSDLGTTWQDRSNPVLTTSRNYKLSFFDENTGYMVSNDGNVFYTVNRGVTWSARATLTGTILYDIKMVNQNLGYAVGSGDRIFKTTDGGSWAHGTLAAPTGQMTGLYMLSATIGYVCGENGAVYKTTDGFQTIQLMTDTAALAGKVVHDVIAFSEQDVWAVTQKGLILRSISPTQMAVVDTALNGEDLTGIAKLTNRAFAVSGFGGSVYRIDIPVVPVELVSCTASAGPQGVVIAWATASELNNSKFTIERLDGGNRVAVGTVTGSGTTQQRSEYHCTDPLGTAGSIYVLTQVDYDGTTREIARVEAAGGPAVFALRQNYPNPFNPATEIRFTLPEPGNTTLAVYDAAGSRRAVLINGMVEAGSHSVTLDARELGLSSGIYFCRLQSGSRTAVNKIMLLK